MAIRHLTAAAALLVCGLASAQSEVQWTVGSGGNGHFYLFVGDNITAQEAFTAAAAKSFQGMQGYLATITSAAENTFVAETVAGGQLAWLGGSDAGAPINDWTWRVGPEAGQAFTFTAWESFEPNNCCSGEDYVHVNFSQPGGWNDHGGPGNAGQVNGYVVEFMAPVPEPQSYALMLAGLATLGAWVRRRRQS